MIKKSLIELKEENIINEFTYDLRIRDIGITLGIIIAIISFCSLRNIVGKSIVFFIIIGIVSMLVSNIETFKRQ